MRRRMLRTRRVRGVRVTQLVVFSLLALVIVGVSAYAIQVLRSPVPEPGVIAPKTFGEAAVEATCPDPDALPLPPEEVSVQVLNGTDRSGFAADVSEQLGERGYDVQDPGNTSQATGPATIVHGPEGYLAAQSVRAQLTDAELRLDEREGGDVDLLLGSGFSELADESDASAALEQPVDLPEGCE